MITSPIELRHQLHRNPELMFKEFKTTELLLNSISLIEGIKIHRPLETGLVVEYRVNNKDFFLFRADIDALPIKEDTGAEFSSGNDNMHACGHDVHASILYGLIRYVTENRVNRNFIFLFQPGEEGGGGAQKIIDSGILNNFNISRAFALHVTDEYAAGTIASTAGVLFASAFEVDIEIYGKSGHVAFPENGIHSFNAFRKFLDQTDKLLEHESEKFIFGYGKVVSGEIRNIIPSLTRAECTIRALSSQKAEDFLAKLVTILDTLQDSMGITYHIHKGPLYSEVVVNKELFEKYRQHLEKKYNFIDCGYKMTGEDFGFFSKLYPSFMCWLGTSEGTLHGLHNPKFLPNDKIIELGIEVFKEILNEEK